MGPQSSSADVVLRLDPRVILEVQAKNLKTLCSLSTLQSELYKSVVCSPKPGRYVSVFVLLSVLGVEHSPHTSQVLQTGEYDIAADGVGFRRVSDYVPRDAAIKSKSKGKKKKKKGKVEEQSGTSNSTGGVGMDIDMDKDKDANMAEGKCKSEAGEPLKSRGVLSVPPNMVLVLPSAEAVETFVGKETYQKLIASKVCG
jgi:hypothetical protein